MIGLISDAVLCLLLIVTLAFAYRLNGKLSDMREGQGDLQTLVTALNDAVDKANTSIVNLRLAAREADEMLVKRVDGARSLSDELGFMTESGNRLAGRLSDGLAKSPAQMTKLSASVYAPDEAEKASLRQMLKSVQRMK
jgi:Domain of unknown function (DUF6468)